MTSSFVARQKMVPNDAHCCCKILILTFIQKNTQQQSTSSESNSVTDNTMNDSTIPATAIAIVVARGKHATLEISVAAQIPLKRQHVKDIIQFEIQHFEFMDDKRSLSHLDALISRMAPLSCIHLGCTEKAEVSKYMG